MDRLNDVTVPIIMLNWKGFDDTRACWASLKNQTWSNFVLFLLENGSGDAEAAAVRAAFQKEERVRLLFNPENSGFTKGNNRILAEHILTTDAYPYVVLLNNDTVVERDWLANLVRAARHHSADMVASKMINFHDRSRMDNAGHKILNTLEVLPIGRDEAVEDYMTAFVNAGPCGGAGLYSVDMLRDIGIFDERFVNGYEDVELGLRGIICGYKSMYTPDAVVYHKISRSVNRVRDLAYTITIQRNIYYITGKLIPWTALLACAPFVILRFMLAFVINLLALRFKYLAIQIRAAGSLWFTDLPVILKARRAFAGKRRISAIALLRRMEFFLRQDVKRFHKYIIRGEKMVFEKYK